MLLLEPADLNLPSRPASWFGREAPVAVEVGIGSGQFVADLAEAHPDWNVVGVELAPASVTRSYRLLARRGLENARLFKGDAGFFGRNLAAPHSLDRVYINFPDPWPRRRHHARRLGQEPFLRMLSSRLVDDGVVLLTSDHPEYFAWAVEQARRTGLYRVEERPPPVEVQQSKYARKSTEQWDHTIQHAAFVKIDEEAGWAPNLELDTMHHAVLEGTLPDLDRLDKLTHTYEGGHIIVQGAYRRLQDDGLIFLVHLEEHGLGQDLLIEARPSRQGIFLGLKRFGAPLFTRGVSEAVAFLADWLAEQGMTVVHRRY